MQDFEQLSEERKQEQAKGNFPDWYTTQSYQMFKKKYAVDGEAGVWGRHRTIAKTLAQYMPNPEYWEEKFFEVMWKGWLSPATPVLANTGTDRGMNVSCSGQYVGDSVDSFYKNRHEAAMLSKHGFGCSGYFGDIRPRGTAISKGGTADGPVPVILGFAKDASEVSQGSNRRGSIASYLPINHDDFYELQNTLLNKPDGLNIGWNVHDEFIERLQNADEDANKRFQEALYTKLVTGKGYYFFPDKANRQRPQMYKDLGLDIKASNLCVAPETKILTSSGYIPIAELEDEVVDVWNGKEWSEVTVRKTGEDQQLVKVITDSGYEIECTPYHKFYIFNGYGKEYKEVRAHELQPGDKLAKFDTPVITGGEELERAYENGFYSGDGCCYKGQQIIYLYHEKRNLVDNFSNVKWNSQENQKRFVGHTTGLHDKFFVPDNQYSVDSRLDWLAGYMDADGCVYRNGDNQQIVVSSIEKNFLKELQMMLQTLGVSSKIVPLSDEGYRELPLNNGSGDLGEFWCKESWRLIVTSCDVYKLLDLGLNCRRLELVKRLPQRDAKRFVKVESVVDEGRVDDTYCFNEPKRHMGMFNGILTGQCSEIMLHSSEEYTYSCILSSMNISKYDEWKDTNAVYVATVFLDCLITDFLIKSEGIPGFEKVRKFTEKGRAIGLGAMGFSTYLQKKMVAFDDLDAQFINNEIFKHIHDESLRASQDLAEMLGEPEWCEGYGVRNTHRTALAPTKSTALMMGGVSESVFPDPGMVFELGSAAGNMKRITPVFYELMKEKGVYCKETIDDIINHVGSVQHVDWLTDQEKRVFRTAFEVNNETILRYASQRQKYICQGQSLNFYVSEDGDEERIAQLHTDAFLDENILSLYYIYSRSGVIVNKECESCSG